MLVSSVISRVFLSSNPTNTTYLHFIAPDWLLNVWDRGSAMAITPDGLRCQSREQKEWHGCRANKGVHSNGKYYYEATVTDEGLCRVGWSTPLVRTCLFPIYRLLSKELPKYSLLLGQLRSWY